MNSDVILRPAQQDIMAYRGGKMAVSAVPGSGKTFTLSLLAAQLIADGLIDVAGGQQVLIVTYLNASVDTFRIRVRRQLHEMGLDDEGYDVRTLHSLSLEIIRFSGDTLADELLVLDDIQRSQHLAMAVDGWIADNGELWEAFLLDAGRSPSPQLRARWRDTTESTAATFIRAAKNEQYSPERIREELERQATADYDPDDPTTAIGRSPLLHMLTGIYRRYQASLTRIGGLDYDDLIWRAADLLHYRPDLTDALRAHWPTVLEDEAQDSVPLQELLLERLTGPGGNWVRVGDPNQAITSTFTAAHPRFFNAFIDRDDVVAKTLPNSGRSARLIMGAANAILHWTMDEHPVPEVRTHTFRRQDILPTPPGDAQPNPPDDEADIAIRVYGSREDEELPAVAHDAHELTRQRPDDTIAILVPTNQIGFAIADHLDALDADYDNLLRGSGREREVASVLHAILGLLANPLDTKALINSHAGLYALREETGWHPAVPGELDDLGHFHTLLRSIYRPESVLFPEDEDALFTALPVGVATEDELAHLDSLAEFLARLFDLRALPVDDLTLALADEVFGPRREIEGLPDAPSAASNELDLAIAYQIASQLRMWREAQPEWRLPELVAQLDLVASGRRTLMLVRADDLGYEPQPGRITLTTQHSAKGLEWDAVFLVGVDGFWIPGTLESSFLGVSEFIGGDAKAEAVAQLEYLMQGEAGLFPERNPTDSAHIEVIAERLRLLYVGITRARRLLRISRSRSTRQYSKEREAVPATVMGVLYQYLKGRRVVG
jgi:DNA helicase-2/ATP-dependent DNA helicase PcrA